MIGNLEPEENVMRSADWVEHLNSALQELEWTADDEIAVEIGGTSVYGINGAGTKWAPTLGTVKYNKDAFIVIKNKTRDPIVRSQPNPELKQAHPYEEKK